MFIYKDFFAGDYLIKTGANDYKMKISGWASGGFSAQTDAEALAIFKNILTGEN